LSCGFAVATNVRAGDETGRYFEQLRRRGLFAVAEHYALSRLKDPQLSPAMRADLTVELSSTFAAHATVVSPQQREELWTKARDVVQEALQAAPPLPRSALLRAQLGLVAARRAEIRRWDAVVAPQDPLLHDNALRAIDEGAKLLSEEVTRLEAGLKQGGRARDLDLPPHEARHLLQGLRLEIGHLERQRAMLLPAGSPDRASALVDAQEAYRAVLAGADDPRRDALAKLGLADCTRLQRDFKRAREMCAAIAGTQPPLDADLQQAVEACRLRCLLDENQPLAAAEALLAIRRTEPLLSGELWLIQLQTLLALRSTAEQKQDADLADHLRAEAELVLQRVDEQVGGAWSLWCRQLWNGDRSRRQYGETLDRLITRARSEYQAGNRDDAAPLYAEAAATARQQNERELAIDLGTTHGSVLLELKQFAAAAAALAAIVEYAPDHARAAAADLLGAYALGRSYEQQRTQSRRTAYTSALERHLERFQAGTTVGDALFMLAQLQEQRLQFSQALPLYLRIASDQPRYLDGTAGAARCDVNLLLRLKTLKQDWSSFHAEAVAELERRIAVWKPPPWSPVQGEVLLQLAKLRLWADPPDGRTAAAVLEQFDTAAVVATEHADIWRALRQQAVPLKLVAWAGSGRSLQARQLLTATPLQNPADLLAVVTGLDQLASGHPDGQFVDLTELLVDAVQRLEGQRDKLPAEARQRFDLARVRAYLVSGRTDRALAVAKAFPQDVASQRELATSLQTSRDAAALAIAKTGWQTVQSLSTAGSSEWMSARLQEVEVCLALGDRAEALKLLRLTRLLYPDLNSPELQQRFVELEQRVK